MNHNENEVANIIDTLAELDRGNFIIHAGRRLQELNKAIAEVRGKGTLTIKLKITPVGISEKTGKVNQMEIQPEITIDKPEHPLRKSTFFADEEARLTREDPDQMDMFTEREPQKANG